MMITRADIKKFLLALPLAVMLSLGWSGEARAIDLNTFINATILNIAVHDAREKITEDYYADKKAVEIDPEIRALLEKLKDEEDVLTPMEKLASFTGLAGANNFGETRMTDSKATDMMQRIRRRLNKLSKKGLITYEQNQAILKYANEQLFMVGAKRAKEAAEAAGNESKTNRIENSVQFTQEDVMIGDCPTVDLIRAKYQAGCWSCLVVEKLSSAFMTAASKAYSLSQRAGLVLLGLGSILWILFWGLRNVSSLTQLEPGNILNELIKFGFKVALAYIFITLGLRMVSTYFINPIMGLGAKIAETYWDKEKIKPYTQEYVWDDIDEEAIAKEEKAAIEAQQNAPQAETQQPAQEYTAEQQALIDAQKEADKKAEPQEIPTFLVPGTNTGHLTSPVGCRIRPKVKCTGSPSQYKSGGNCYGSASHMGLDIGTSGKEGGVVFAMAGGKITYWGGASSSAGYAATIQTKDKRGNTWSHRYLHMQPRAHSDFKFPSGEVATGQQIGYIGNTGGSSGAHLHVEIRFTGTWEGKKYNDVPLDPLRLVNGTFYPLYASQCTGSNVATFPQGFKSGQTVPSKGWPTSDKAVFDLSATYVENTLYGGSSLNYNSLVIDVPQITYTGPTDIMSKAVMNSILGATKAIGDITSENMILGDAIMCYASLDNGGAWHPFGYVVTNFWMWVEGMFIWCTGMLLTIAIAYYLLDLSFKIGFAVIALPLVVGLWPFEITRDKVALCIGIIAKSAATFAFLAMTTTFTVLLTDAVYSYEDDNSNIASETTVEDSNAPKGLAKLYAIYDRATMTDVGAAQMSDAQKAEDINYAASKLAIFSSTFVLILFAFLYSFKLVQSTVPSLVNKFFPDNAFGDQSPMHHWATAASRWAKNQAMKPVGWARDAAMYQGGKLAKNMVGKTVGSAVGMAKSMAGKGSGKAKTLGGMAARGAGGITQGIGRAMSAAGLKKAGAAVQNVGKEAKEAGNSIDKAYNKFGTRNKKDNAGGETSGADKKQDAQEQDGGGK